MTLRLCGSRVLFFGIKFAKVFPGCFNFHKEYGYAGGQACKQYIRRFHAQRKKGARQRGAPGAGDERGSGFGQFFAFFTE
jgi:hypothetical protein